jgi:hypothetical protein
MFLYNLLSKLASIKRDWKFFGWCNIITECHIPSYSPTYALTYLLHGRVLLEELTGSLLVKKFLTFYRTRKLITACTSACHLSISCARSIQSAHLLQSRISLFKIYIYLMAVSPVVLLVLVS